MIDRAIKIEVWEKIYCNQTFNSQLFDGDVAAFEHASFDAIMDVCCFQEINQKYDLRHTDVVATEIMSSSPVVFGFLQWLCASADVKRVLEIGTFLGISAMEFAEAVGPDGHVVTIEKFDKFAEIARGNIARNGFSDMVDVVCADAINFLPSMEVEYDFDLIFIDGNKENYADYMRLTQRMLKSGGIMVVDDILFHGDPLNADCKTDKGRGVLAALEHAKSMVHWKKTILPVANGILLMLKP